MTDDQIKAAQAELRKQNELAKKSRQKFSRGLHPRVAAIRRGIS